MPGGSGANRAACDDRHPMARRSLPSWLERAAPGVGAGLLLAASLPPWGWWPLAFVGMAILDRYLADRPHWSRFRRLALVAGTLFVPTLWWIHDLTLPGYVIAVATFAAMVGLCGLLVPPGRGRRLALPAAWVLAEGWKGRFPFGGVPISDLAIGQVGGPLAGAARLGGGPLLAALVVTGGIALSAAAARRWSTTAIAVAVLAVALGAAGFAPRGHDVGAPVRVAIVQGGGPQGTRAINTDMNEVFERHLRASGRIETPVDLVLWPEDVIDLDESDIADPDEPKGRDLVALARRLDAPVLAGVVQDEGDKHFRNYTVVVRPDGSFGDRYEKVHRVPFGEYVPLRAIVAPFAGPALTQRDAVPGTGPAVVNTSAGPVGVTISWEIFFADRARAAIRDGGELLANPTNGSTYTGTLVQTQQVASSRLRALETDRWVLQAAPTGFSAVIREDGTVVARTALVHARVLQETVRRRRGETVYVRTGDVPMAGVVIVLLAGAWGLARHDDRRRRGRLAGAGGGSEEPVTGPDTSRST